MADPDSLTPNQLEKVMQFQEVTGCTDVCVCVCALSAAGWDVEPAVHQHLTKASAAGDNEDGSENRETEAASSTVRRRVTENTGNSGTSANTQGDGRTPPNPGLATPPPAAAVVPARGGGLFQRLQQWGVFFGYTVPSRVLFRWPIRFCYWSVQSLLSIAYTLLYSTSAAPDPMRDMDQFVAQYAASYPGVAHPPFYKGSYSQALSLAKQQLQFLLVYLHCGHHLSTDAFCRSVLSDDRVRNYISDNNILFWACDVALPEGYRVSQALRENDYPYLALIVLRNTRMSVVGRLEGEALLQPQYVVDTLSRRHDSSMPFVTAARVSRLEREQAVALRQEQDTAYQMSLRVDREKQRKKEEEQQQKRDEEERERKRLQDEQDMKTSMKEMIPEEPETNSPGSLELVVKLPGGERIERRFHADQPLSVLYCLLYTNEHAPNRFEVTTNFPRKVVPCSIPACFKGRLSQIQQEQQVQEPSSLQQQQSNNTPSPPPPLLHSSSSSSSSTSSIQQAETSSSSGASNIASSTTAAIGSEQQQDNDIDNIDEQVEPTFGSFGIASRTVLFVKDLDA